MAKNKASANICEFLEKKIPILDDVIYYIPNNNIKTFNDYAELKATEQKTEMLKQLAKKEEKEEKSYSEINEFENIGFDDIEIEERNNDYDDDYIDTGSYDYMDTEIFIDTFDEPIEEFKNPRFMDSSSFIEIIDTNPNQPHNDFIIESLDNENEIIQNEIFTNDDEDNLADSLFDNGSFSINDLESLADSNEGLEEFDFDSINGAKKPLATIDEEDDDLLDDGVNYIKKVKNINNISSDDKDDYSSFMLKMKIREDKK